MPIGIYDNGQELQPILFPDWIQALLDCWDDMPIVPFDHNRKQSYKRRNLDKAFHFLPDDLPNNYGDLSTPKLQMNLRNSIHYWMECAGFSRTTHYHIAMIESTPEHRRLVNTPRICYVFRIASESYCSTSDKLRYR